MLSRLGASLLFLTLVALGLAYVTDYTFHIPIDKAVRADLSAAASPERINGMVLAALEKDDIEEADMYADIGKYMNYQIPIDTQRRLDEAHSMSATVVRNTWEFGTGFVTGEVLHVDGGAHLLAYQRLNHLTLAPRDLQDELVVHLEQDSRCST